jgi:hypothetical protein
VTSVPIALVTMLGAFACGTAVNVGAAMLPGRVALGRLASVLVTMSLLVAPFVVEVPPLMRALLAQALIVETWRVLEIARTPERFGSRERALRVVLLPFEHTFLERTERRWPVRDFVLSALVGAIGIAGLALVVHFTSPVTPYAPQGWPRWLGATVAGYVIMEGVTWHFVSVLPAFGFTHRKYQRHPIVSRTLAEFWGVRWSSVVHRWLRSNIYEPLARRRAASFGIVAAFAWSAVLHAYMVLPAAGVVPALWMLSFFLAHGVMMVFESKLRVRRWRPAAGRAFVVAFFVATIPLFMEPILRAIEL